MGVVGTAPITISSNLKNPTNEEILYEGSCGNFARNFDGYPTLQEALNGASPDVFIYVARDIQINTPTTFLDDNNYTLVIRDNVTLSFTAPFTNEGIVINHGTLEMVNGAVLTNQGALVNAGIIISD